MKKPNITEGEWEFYPVYHEGTIMTAFIKSEKYSIGKIAPNNELNNEIANARAISAVPNMIDTLIKNYNLLLSVKNNAKSEDEFEQAEDALLEVKSTLEKVGVEL